jgi:hypothetical protein
MEEIASLVTPESLKESDEKVENAPTTSISSTTTTPTIKNKTREPEILHSVEAKADPITKHADKEEEDWIKEQMEEHQNGS